MSATLRAVVDDHARVRPSSSHALEHRREVEGNEFHRPDGGAGEGSPAFGRKLNDTVVIEFNAAAHIRAK